MVVTEPQAREMFAAIEAFQAKDLDAIDTQRQAARGLAIAWFNQQGININAATTRTQAISNFNQIEALLQTETDPVRLNVLRNKLKEANQKYIDVKKVNPNS